MPELDLPSQIPWLTKFAFRLTRGDADAAFDLLQSTLLKAWQNRGRFDGRNIQGWLGAIMFNEWAAVCRKRKTLCEIPEDLAASTGTPESNAYAHEVIRRTPPILAMAAQGLAYEEMASELGIPVGTVRSRISRARTKLAEAVL